MAYIGKEPTFGAFEKDIFTGDGSTTQFTLTHNVASATSIIVSLGGVIQEPGSAYDIAMVSGVQKINFASAPANSVRCFVVYLGRQQIVQARAATDTTPTIDTFTGGSGTTAFTLSRVPQNPSSTVIAFVNGVFQKYTTNFSIAGTTITFTSAPETSAVIVVVHLSTTNEVNLGSPDDNSVGTAKIQDNAVTNAKAAFTYTSSYFTGDGSTTAFTITTGHTVNSIIVTENGVIKKPTTDYSVSGTTLTFSSAPGNTVQVGVRYLVV
jgi:hypothetical protein